MQTQRKTGNNIHFDRVLSVWREEVTTAANGPDIKQRLLHQERELSPRFAAQYRKLSILPPPSAPRDAAAMEAVAGRCEQLAQA